MKLSIVTPEKKLLMSAEISEAFIPGQEGEINVLPGHAPLITTLETGVLQYVDASGNKKSVAISWGYCEIFSDEINVLADTAETPEEIDIERAKEAHKKSLMILEKGDEEGDRLQKYQAKLKRSAIRMNLVSKDH